MHWRWAKGRRTLRLDEICLPFCFVLTLTFSHYFEFLLFCLTAMTIRWRNNSAGLYHRSRAQVLRRSYTEGKKKREAKSCISVSIGLEASVCVASLLASISMCQQRKGRKTLIFFHFLVFCFRLAMSLLFVGKTKNKVQFENLVYPFHFFKTSHCWKLLSFVVLVS